MDLANRREDDSPLLDARDVTVTFGGIRALSDVGVTIRSGEVKGLIGPNGAGKTTLLNCISRLQATDSGSLHLKDVDLSKQKPSSLARLGLSRTFQHAHLSPQLTSLENVLIGAHARSSTGLLGCVLGLRKARLENIETLELASDLLKSLDLWAYAERAVSSLPTPIQKRIDIARALASLPSLILMDEPAAGLNEADVSELVELIQGFRVSHGVKSVLLVEHNVAMVLKVCDSITALNFGKEIASGSPQEIRSNPAVIQAYLG